MKLIGRAQETQILRQLLGSKEPELAVVYGRRRIGKTFLIREIAKEFSGAKFLEIVGNKTASKEIQLESFIQAFSAVYHDNAALKIPSSWQDALNTYSDLVQKSAGLHILFLDELPWLAGRRSGLLTEIDSFWNRRWSRMPNLKVVLCGSAASWMLEKLVHAKGGLHNRLTRILALKPFSLHECEQYLQARRVMLSRRQIIDLVLCTGGVPFYLNGICPGRSSAQAIQDLCFNSSGILFKEHDSLFPALFNNSSIHEHIVALLSRAHYGLTRAMIIKRGKLADGGALTRALKELVSSNFLGFYTPFGRGKRDGYYRIIDPFTLFYARWIAPIKKTGIDPTNDYWLKQCNSSAAYAVAGYSFENICLNHISQILQTLQISGMLVNPCSWQAPGAQIDLVLDRADRIVNLCEIKHQVGVVSITAKLVTDIQNKTAKFIEQSGTKRSVTPVLISSGDISGFAEHQGEIASIVQGPDLFRA